MHLSSPVHIRGSGQEPQDHALGTSSVGVLLRVHRLDDLVTNVDPGQRMIAMLDLLGRDRFELRHRNGFAIGSDGDEDDKALTAHCGCAAPGIS